MLHGVYDGAEFVVEWGFEMMWVWREGEAWMRGVLMGTEISEMFWLLETFVPFYFLGWLWFL